MHKTVSLTWLKKDAYFLGLFRKLSTEEELNTSEYTYLLACSILFIKEYENDQRKTKNFEFGYFIVLKYSISTGDYYPLFDLSVNSGFYPMFKTYNK